MWHDVMFVATIVAFILIFAYLIWCLACNNYVFAYRISLINSLDPTADDDGVEFYRRIRALKAYNYDAMYRDRTLLRDIRAKFEAMEASV